MKLKWPGLFTVFARVLSLPLTLSFMLFAGIIVAIEMGLEFWFSLLNRRPKK